MGYYHICVIKPKSISELIIQNINTMVMSMSTMKPFLIILIMMTFSAINGQIVRKGKMITKTIELENIYTFKSNFYADIVIDMAEGSGITITAEENVLDFINVSSTGGTFQVQ